MTGDSVTCRKPGRDQAFLELITGVEDELYWVIRRFVGSRDATEDIVQRTFLLAWSNAKFDPAHIHARTWLFTTGRRLAIAWLESAESRWISLEDLSAGPRRDGSHGSCSAPPVDRRARDPLRELIEAERNRHLNDALARLPPEMREVLERFYLRKEGTQTEIAEVMDISVAALNSRLNRARKELKRAILILRVRDGGDGDGYD
jgi:RNA polymerase sigma-70 factor (ECF subfamily)